MRSAFAGTATDDKWAIIYPVLAQNLKWYLLETKQRRLVCCCCWAASNENCIFSKDEYPKSQSFRSDKRLLGAKLLGCQNILALNGTGWKKHRMIANPAFHRHMPVKLFGKLCEKMMSRLETEDDGLSHVNVPAMMQRFTVDVIGLAAFGYDFQSIGNPNFDKVKRYNFIIHGLRSPLFFFFPFFEKHMLWAFPVRRQQHLNCDAMFDLYQKVIENKRKVMREQKERQEDPEKDLLSLMLEAGEDVASQALTDEELCENIATFFLAGHDTTSNALSFALYFLALHPDIQENARKEVLEIMGDGADVVYPTESQIGQMKYIYMVMKETLRLCPPVQSSQLRRVVEDPELAGTIIPKGVHVQAEIFLAHHNPVVCKDPELFRRERYASGGENEEIVKNGLAWAPFGNGARQCIGMSFSLAEQRVVLSMLLRKFTWSLPEDSIHKDHIVFTGGQSLLSARNLYLSFKERL